MKTTVVLLTWKRIPALKKTLMSLASQTNKNFDVRISNGNLQNAHVVENIAKYFSDRLKITVSHDGNEIYAFRRFTVGKELAQSGTDIILFIDDDIIFDSTYIESCLSRYKPKTYQSGFTWSFQRGGTDYYKYRNRVQDLTSKIHYCGTGVSMIDASIFLDDRIFAAPKEAYLIEDVWLSYFAQHVKGWDLLYIPMKNVHIGGTDQHALYKKIVRDKKLHKTPDKADFLRLLIKKYKWEL